tara:strand:- start:6165 stop:6392 length:228 start_codon:yes stop_codon:yes gene_type:complete
MTGCRGQVKLRKLVSNNKTGDVYGITVKEDIAIHFSGAYFTQEVRDDCIIFTSGCQMQRKVNDEQRKSKYAMVKR